MRFWHYMMLPLAVLAAGCSNPDFTEDQPNPEALFSAAAMRIHPIFTQVKDWNGDGKPDGIEVMIEFHDPFGDPAKASGIVRFELYSYRKGNPEPRGARVVNPWAASLASFDDQRARWNRTSQTYTFQLAYPNISTTESYVLTATFKPTGDGRRLDAKVVLAGQEDSGANAPTTQPTGIIPHP